MSLLEDKGRRANQRYNFSGRVFIFLNKLPWKIVVSMNCENISFGGLFAKASYNNMNIGVEGLSVEDFLKEGMTYKTQIEYENEHVLFPMCDMKLQRVNKNNSEYSMALSFVEQTSELHGAIGEVISEKAM